MDLCGSVRLELERRVNMKRPLFSFENRGPFTTLTSSGLDLPLLTVEGIYRCGVIDARNLESEEVEERTTKR